MVLRLRGGAKKRKKKTVAFSEDPLGADADPTTPAPDEIDNVTTNGDAVDMGPTTMHEQMKQNGITREGMDDGEKKEDDDEDIDLFGSDDEEDAEAERIKAERVAAYNAKKAAKPKTIAKVGFYLFLFIYAGV